jgi:hypothetical protein
MLNEANVTSLNIFYSFCANMSPKKKEKKKEEDLSCVLSDLHAMVKGRTWTRLFKPP